MRTRALLIATALTLVESVAPAQPAHDSRDSGLSMTISAVTAEGAPARVIGFDVTFRNAGQGTALLDLGETIGPKDYPTAVRLTLTDSKGQAAELHCSEFMGMIAGRVDAFIVPVRPGEPYTFRVPLGNQCWVVPSYSKPAAGRYRIEASLTGKGQKCAVIEDVDCWKGSIRSNSIEFEIATQFQ